MSDTAEHRSYFSPDGAGPAPCGSAPPGRRELPVGLLSLPAPKAVVLRRQCVSSDRLVKVPTAEPHPEFLLL